MKLSTLIKIIDIRENEMLICDKWLESLPNEISTAFFDNTYVNTILNSAMDLFKLHFDNDTLYSDVEWFLYEWQPGFDIRVNDKEYVINNKADYISYLKENYKFDE